MDPLLLDPTRLSIVALLVGTQWAEFGWVRDSVGLSDSALSKQITKLSNTGHVAGLHKIVDQSQQTGSTHLADQPP